MSNNQLGIENQHLTRLNDTLRNLVTEYSTKYKEIEMKLTYEFKRKEDEYTSEIEQLQQELISHKMQLSHKSKSSSPINHKDKAPNKYDQLLNEKHQLQHNYDSLQNKFNGQIKMIQDQFESKYNQLQNRLFVLRELIHQKDIKIMDLESTLHVQQAENEKSVIGIPYSRSGTISTENPHVVYVSHNIMENSAISMFSPSQSMTNVSAGITPSSIKHRKFIKSNQNSADNEYKYFDESMQNKENESKYDELQMELAVVRNILNQQKEEINDLKSELYLNRAIHNNDKQLPIMIDGAKLAHSQTASIKTEITSTSIAMIGNAQNIMSSTSTSSQGIYFYIMCFSKEYVQIERFNFVETTIRICLKSFSCTRNWIK